MHSDAPLQNLSVIIVEDDFIIAARIESTYRKAGAAAVSIFGTVADAWDAVRNTRFDFALLDIHLPDGLSFPLAMDLFADGVPVVMHSGHAEIYHSARLPGIIFCPKPATPAEIVRASLKAIQFKSYANIAQLEDTLH